MHILIIEDEAKTSAYLKKGFSENGINADIAEDGEIGIERIRTGEYDLIVLDVMLPRRDGWSVIADMRRRGNETPVIMLTALDLVPDRVRGLELGVDDYLVKPFAFTELLARIRTILRRGPSLKQDILRVADLEIDLLGHRVSRGGKRLDLTPKEFMLLSLLARHAGEAMTRRRIAEIVWNIRFENESNLVDVHMRRLRAKVDDPFELKLLYTVRGVGYVLEER